MFQPKYTITPELLENIKKITVLVTKLNSKSFPKTVLFELEKLANAVSTHSSTAIEGNPLPLTDVKQLIKSKSKNIKDTEQEVFNYNQALEYLKTLKQSHTLDQKLILKVHSLVMNKLMNKTKLGVFRKEPIFVNNPKTGQTIFWPPDHNKVSKLVGDLIGFVKKQKSKLDPLILSAIFHKQFVIIHPFIDGNGRSTRLLTKHLLANLGLNTFNLFSFENYYNKNVTKYFQTVGELGNYYDLIKKIDFTEWLEYFTDGILDELLRVEALLRQQSINPAQELKKQHLKITKYIEKHGYINDKLYSHITERAKATRSLDFKKLIELGIIERHGQGKATYYKIKTTN